MRKTMFIIIKFNYYHNYIVLVPEILLIHGLFLLFIFETLIVSCSGNGINYENTFSTNLFHVQNVINMIICSPSPFSPPYSASKQYLQHSGTKKNRVHELLMTFKKDSINQSLLNTILSSGRKFTKNRRLAPILSILSYAITYH